MDGTGAKPTDAGEPERPLEIETALVVCSETPGDVLDAVAALRELAGFELRPRPDETIRDVYFDTPDGRVAAAGGALRAREVGGRTLLTIKWPSGSAGARVELEEEWPGRAWETLRAELGAELDLPATPPAADAAEALRLSGLEVVQERETRRRVRDVAPPGGERLAELAVDSVAYRLPGGPVRLHEVEIEAKTADAAVGEAAVATVAQALTADFRTALRPWPHGKLPTGRAVEELLAVGERDALVADDGSLLPGAYDAIAARLGPG